MMKYWVALTLVAVIGGWWLTSNRSEREPVPANVAAHGVDGGHDLGDGIGDSTSNSIEADVGRAPAVAASASSAPLPAATAAIPQPPPPALTAPAQLQLWDGPFTRDQTERVPALAFEVEPAKLEQLRTGQVIDFTLGEGVEPISAEVHATANQGSEVQLWRAKVLNRGAQDNVVIARGQTQTHVTVYADSTTYSVVIDNVTGAATLVDEGDIHETTVPYEDGIALPEVPDTLPPL